MREPEPPEDQIPAAEEPGPSELPEDYEGALEVLDDLESLELELKDERDKTIPPIILIGGAIGLVVGVFLWGAVALSAMSGMLNIFDDDTGSNDGLEQQLTDDEDIDAEATATVEAEPTLVPTSADPTLNRRDCDSIRGTEYRSVEERQWFLENCLGP